MKNYIFDSYSRLCRLPSRSYLIGVLIEWNDSTAIHSFLIQFLFDTLDSYCTILLYIHYRYSPVRGVDNFQVFLITLGLQPYSHEEFDSWFVFDWTYWLCPKLYFCIFNPSMLWRQYCGSYLCQTQVGMMLPAVLCDRCF
jgi:hypothetical protein